jgi:hypothetical protein
MPDNLSEFLSNWLWSSCSLLRDLGLAAKMAVNRKNKHYITKENCYSFKVYMTSCQTLTYYTQSYASNMNTCNSLPFVLWKTDQMYGRFSDTWAMALRCAMALAPEQRQGGKWSSVSRVMTELKLYVSISRILAHL